MLRSVAYTLAFGYSLRYNATSLFSLKHVTGNRINSLLSLKQPATPSLDLADEASQDTGRSSATVNHHPTSLLLSFTLSVDDLLQDLVFTIRKQLAKEGEVNGSLVQTIPTHNITV
jgi:hypothetical protein